MTIAFKEKMNVPPNVVNALIEGTGADIRQVVNMVSTVKLRDQNIEFQDAKDMSKAWEKHVILKPWDITGKILGGGMFAANSKATLNDKIELYFNDHDFSFLMLQENYLNTAPLRANSLNGPERKLKLLELVEKASESISDGDLVDRLIHGAQQQWSLMPTHGVFSFVRPASFISGSMAYGKTSFTSWLGNNSKQGKFTRVVKEIQSHMRLRTAADRHEVRQLYVPMFWDRMPKRLSKVGKDSVPEVIDIMDSYYLTRDDFDGILELGIGKMDQSTIKIDSGTKAAFTRM
jgi:replication factor C subunit 1